MNPLADLVRSAHGCIYAYGVIAAFLPDPDPALDAMAAHRQIRDALLVECSRLGVSAPPAAVAYDVDIANATQARATAAALENAACAQWASAMPMLSRSFARTYVSFAVDCALRGYEWSGQALAFPA